MMPIVAQRQNDTFGFNTKDQQNTKSNLNNGQQWKPRNSKEGTGYFQWF